MPAWPAPWTSPASRELLDEAIVWHQPGANLSGEHKGRDAVFQMLGSLMETSRGTFTIDKIHTLMANGDLVAATIHFSGGQDDAAMSRAGPRSLTRSPRPRPGGPPSGRSNASVTRSSDRLTSVLTASRFCEPIGSTAWG